MQKDSYTKKPSIGTPTDVAFYSVRVQLSDREFTTFVPIMSASYDFLRVFH